MTGTRAHAGGVPQVSLPPPRRVALLSPCGWGNLGDAAILDSVIAAIRARAPNAEVIGFTLHPDDTRIRHGIPAYTLLGFSRRLYQVEEDSAPRESTPGPSGSRHREEGLRGLARRIPGLRTAYHLARGGQMEVAHRRRSREILEGVDLFVVAGGGQLDDIWGGPFGHPYVLYRWASLARKAGARYVVLSVGTGTLDSALSRLFVRRALERAVHLSFRDEGSRRLAAQAGVPSAAPVVPDLAYGVPLPAARTPLRGPRPIVGVSPMVYLAPGTWPEEDERAHRRYLESVAGLVRASLDRGGTIVLFATTRSDNRTIDQLSALLEPSLPPGDRARLLRPPVTGVASLLELLRGLDVAVASRLHGVLLSHVAGLPCLAIPHERKVAQQMRDMEQESLCLDIEGFRPDEAVRLLDRILDQREALAAQIRREVARRRAAVEQQYDLVFGTR